MDDDTSTAPQIPTTIRTFLDAQESRDEKRALPLLTPDAVIVDVADGGEVFSGEEGLRRFIVEAGSEFTYTTELTGVERSSGRRRSGAHRLNSEHVAPRSFVVITHRRADYRSPHRRRWRGR